MSDAVELGVASLWLLPVLAVAAAVLARVAGLGHGSALVTASLRAAAQLAAVGLVVAAALASLPLAGLMLVAMSTVAVVTCARRLGSLLVMGPPALVAVVAPAATVVALLLLSGALPVTPQALLPTGGSSSAAR